MSLDTLYMKRSLDGYEYIEIGWGDNGWIFWIGGPTSAEHFSLVELTSHMQYAHFKDDFYHIFLEEFNLPDDLLTLSEIVNITPEGLYNFSRDAGVAEVFISYSHKDKSFATELANSLRSSGLGIWIDHWQLRAGQSIFKEINKALKQCDMLILILSPESVSSDFVWKEFSSVLMTESENKDIRVIPILYKDCDIPMVLKDKHYIDFRHEDKKSAGFKKLVNDIKYYLKKY